MSTKTLMEGQELDDNFSGLSDSQGFMTVTGFGSLLSERSARTTFPDLQNFRAGRLYGYRRVFAHTADIFYARGIANVDTGEVSSLSCEPWPEGDLVVSLFEVKCTPEAVAAFINREHEFRFIAVQPRTLDGQPTDRLAVLCGRFSDDEYRSKRCPPAEWERRWARWGVTRIWRDDVLPCRLYLRHCVLAARGFCSEAYDSFMDNTFLADRKTSIRAYLAQHPLIMEEQPPPELVGRYSG